MAAQKRKSAAGAGAAPATPEAHAPSSRRRSQRVSSSAQKSKYFEASSNSDTSESERVPKKARGRGRRPAKRAKGAQPEAESDGSGDDYKEEAAGKAAEESGDDEFDEAAPPKVTFVPLPKLRDTGGVEYADDRLHPNTLAFLADLKANNKRSWLKAHDGEYRRALKDWETYVMALTERIIAADPTIPELPFKDVNFRIYRDIRFSNDPTPYKPHFSAAFSRTGRKGPYACYYVHVEPAGAPCFVGGGLWHPDAAALARLRASIDERPRRWRRVLNEPSFREVFLGLPSSSSSASSSSGTGKRTGKTAGGQAGNRRKKSAGGGGEGADEGGKEEEEDPAAALAAFAERNQEGALKTRPKGFVPDHRDMQLLKLRNFTVSRKMDSSVFTSSGGLDEVAWVIRAMVGFVTHLNRIVMPDPGDDDDESDEE
ncbi:70b747c9-8dfd-416e-b1ad-c81284031d8c [Thermothielavioides terrestris]|uniref:70b747c9-8dfd-416e-b1ad-c81284031d8c n=1 Tax=Thermothielavioides terrestris TaxID=2587410 RepID=A0A3S4F4D8_9PEZI|nr:70b747c9-8dfd-416e-b1ad-c81284031d8c [Thermothielavioides terrestris]